MFFDNWLALGKISNYQLPHSDSEENDIIINILLNQTFQACHGLDDRVPNQDSTQ